MKIGKIHGINGPIITVVDCDGFKMSEMVTVSEEHLIGEVISLKKDSVIAQVFEDTSGLRPGENVYARDIQLSVTLAPGIVGATFDGIQRPLEIIKEKTGAFISRGVTADSVDMNKKWPVKFLVSAGARVEGGGVIAQTPETESIMHRIMTPPNVSGVIISGCEDGNYTVTDVIATVEGGDGTIAEVTMAQKWPIRTPRPVKNKRTAHRPLITGQRVIDTLFPIAKGGAAAIPGGFGTGKTMTQHQLAKWSDADLIIYIGCGERGNEMTQVLEDFSKLHDPRTGRPLMDRTTLIANTSNMPVAAREASVYTGVTIAEYYRDMGYHVAIMADSTSRWAEALRELSGRLEEMPAEEGFPAYLASRLSSFYERAGFADTLSGGEGSVTIIGAVSPQGGDFSEPVTQNTKRFVRCFWTLDRSLAYARHFPAIQWLTSYSEYLEDLDQWYAANVGEEFAARRASVLKLLNEENKLMEIVRLIGGDVLPDIQKLTLEIARVIRLGFVQQNAYHDYDTFSPFSKQLKMMEIILYLHDKCMKLVDMNIPMRALRGEKIFEEIIALKYDVSNDEPEKMETYFSAIDAFYDKVYSENV
ncbi:MAG: V-type ATP synthase subunit A [Clostridiales bacterium]|jgi:V/A-type H+-transporting ATPase subunit A|nr:V-type ATP synthase subunit A [Clostridiales bacterium]